MTKSEIIKFEKLPEVDDISGVLEDVFGIKLDVTGGWGYNNNTALQVQSLDIPLNQFFQMFATMRANIEMNLTLDEELRYGGINVTQLDHKEFEIENIKFDVVTFKITGIKEKIYNHFIQEYKDKYGKEDFDLENHFKQREENTIKIESDFWFNFQS
jgi:hypothetical protein